MPQTEWLKRARRNERERQAQAAEKLRELSEKRRSRDDFANRHRNEKIANDKIRIIGAGRHAVLILFGRGHRRAYWYSTRENRRRMKNY